MSVGDLRIPIFLSAHPDQVVLLLASGCGVEVKLSTLKDP